MIKKVLISVAMLLGLAGTFWGGMTMGFTQGFSIGRLNDTMLKEDMTDATIVLMLIKQMDGGEPEKAYGYLNLKLDAYVLSIHNLLESNPGDDVSRLGWNTLKRIAKHRDSHPVSPDGDRSGEIDEFVNSILKESKTKNYNNTRH